MLIVEMTSQLLQSLKVVPTFCSHRIQWNHTRNYLWVTTLSGHERDPGDTESNNVLGRLGGGIFLVCSWNWSFRAQAQTPEVPHISSLASTRQIKRWWWWRSEKGHLLHSLCHPRKSKINTSAHLHGFFFFFLFFFLAVLGFGPWASCLVGRISTAWATPFFFCLFWRQGLTFC
jgi:hypothetical protein